MQIFVQTLSGKTVLTDVDEQQSLNLIQLVDKLRAEYPEDVPAKDEAEGIRFTVAGKQLDNEEELNEETLELISGGQPLVLNFSLVGGKVHGSLARAGKVRAQTPKVEKQEKKKKKRGRACRRMQYNKRFVNVALTTGRRRGPNAQQV